MNRWLLVCILVTLLAYDRSAVALFRRTRLTQRVDTDALRPMERRTIGHRANAFSRNG